MPVVRTTVRSDGVPRGVGFVYQPDGRETNPIWTDTFGPMADVNKIAGACWNDGNNPESHVRMMMTLSGHAPEDYPDLFRELVEDLASCLLAEA